MFSNASTESFTILFNYTRKEMLQCLQGETKKNGSLPAMMTIINSARLKEAETGLYY